MPRNRPGGTRAGTPGTAYTQRTDLNDNRSLPVRVATGQPYGQATQQAQSQRAIPMAPPPSAPTAPQAGSTGQQMIPPGAFGDIHRPTERPLEPVTAGINSGPGPGPEVLPLLGNPQASKVSDVLMQAAQSTGSSVLSSLAQRAATAGQ